MQSVYLGTLMELAEVDDRILHLVADSGTGFDEMFRRNFPDRIYNFGIAEENMVGAAAGLATTGRIPFVFTAGAFLCYRSLEYIRDDICFQNLNVKIVGMGSGLSWSTLGPTHHTTEDIGILRTLPNLMILAPATPMQVRNCVKRAYQHQGPVYIRLEMNKEKEFFDRNHVFAENQSEILSTGNDIAIFCMGSILEEVMQVRDMLSDSGIHATIVNVHNIKPFDAVTVCELANKCKVFCTVEEHNVIGGIGSIISEILVDQGISLKLLKIGLEDSFAKSYGTLKQVRKENGMDARTIYQKIVRMME